MNEIGKPMSQLISKGLKVGDYIYESGRFPFQVRRCKVLFINGFEAVIQPDNDSALYAQQSWYYYETKEDAIKHSIQLNEKIIDDCKNAIEKLKKI